MKAIEIAGFGGPSQLVLAERPMPVPAAGQVLIKVAASGINRPDILQRKGHYPPPPGASDLPGLEVAGTLAGGDIHLLPGMQQGDRVCALLSGGGYAEYALAPVGSVLPIPAGIDEVEAASLPETYFTVWSNVFERGMLGRGEGGAQETLLVQGGSSGIGVAAIQLASAFGHRVFATAGTDEKCRACEALGAAKGINYRSEDFVEEVKSLTQGRGVDVILDMVAGPYVPRELGLLAEGGRLVILAQLGGKSAEVDFSEIMRRRLTLTGSTLRARPDGFKAQIAAQLRSRVWPLFESKRLRPVVHATFDAAQAADAHALMESSTHVGKIVLRW